MKITIKPETDAEKELFAKPHVIEMVNDYALAFEKKDGTMDYVSVGEPFATFAIVSLMLERMRTYVAVQESQSQNLKNYMTKMQGGEKK